jgi:hypothetical protein
MNSDEQVDKCRQTGRHIGRLAYYRPDRKTQKLTKIDVYICTYVRTIVGRLLHTYSRHMYSML